MMDGETQRTNELWIQRSSSKRGTVIFTVKLLTLTVPAPRSKAYNLGKEAITLVAKCQRNRGNLRKLSKAHLCPEMYAVTKIADLTTFRQTDWMFMDLTILANIGQIRQSKISLADFVDFDAFSPFSLRQAFLDISKSLSAVMLSSLVCRLKNIFLLDNEVKLEKKKIQSVRKETFLTGEVEQIRVSLYA